jgi:hypothetical protein
VTTLLERRVELVHQRDSLRAAMAAVRLAPTSEAALADARQRLRAAQDMLRSLTGGRGALGDPVEATVLRLVLDEGAEGTSHGPPQRDRTSATSSGPIKNLAVSRPAPTTSNGAVRAATATRQATRGAETASAAPDPVAAVGATTRTSADAGVPPPPPDTTATGADASDTDSPQTASATDPSEPGGPGGPGADTADEQSPDEGDRAPGGSPRSGPTPATSAGSGSWPSPAVETADRADTMLTFARTSPATSGAEPTPGEDSGTAGTATDAEKHLEGPWNGGDTAPWNGSGPQG